MSCSVRRLWIALVVLLVPAVAPADQTLPSLSLSASEMVHGGTPAAARATRDSLILIGPWTSGAAHNGQFEDRNGMPAWNGWTHADLTAPETSRWQISTYQADNLGGGGPGNLAAWCGEATYPSCDAGDPAGGYGNNYNEILTWTGTVADPDQPCTVTVQARLNLDLENNYDWLFLRLHRYEDFPRTVMSLDGQASDFALLETFVVEPTEYLAGATRRDQVRLDFLVTSDSAYSDEDCYFPSAGACQIDDITVTLSNGGAVSFEDFQTGTFAAWQPELPVGVGDFARIFWSLEDIDPCVTNYTPQVCFIDDGTIVPGTGGAFCIDWCYGPGGYIVNTRGGLAGPDAHLANQVLSPVVAWPASGAEGALLTFGVYNHEDLSADSPGIFYSWHVRSTVSAAAEDLQDAPWRDRNLLYYGPAEYRRTSVDVTDLLEVGATYFQVAFRVLELGYFYGWEGDDGYPAPYFDNVRLTAYPFEGPAMSARVIDLAQDGFPAAGVLDQTDFGANSVRFDMARNIAPLASQRIDPGDSILADIVTRRAGEVLTEEPRLHFRLQANPAFDPYRTSGLGTEGSVPGHQVEVAGNPLAGKFAFDLPDSGFFFPGDVLHYYLEATSFLAGNFLTALLPADTTGFADFSGPLAYDSQFTVRALPSVYEYAGSLRPATATLLWVDGGDLEIWTQSLEGLHIWRGYPDIFETRAPSSALGNGLGSRATVDLLDTYSTLLYTSGTQIRSTICNGFPESADGSDDVGLLDAWMTRGDKSMFLTGDNLAADLYQSGTATQAFLSSWMGVNFLMSDLRPYINNQTTPLVLPEPGGLFTLDGWIAYGGCLSINTFDGVEPLYAEGAQRVAQFASPWGSGGEYTYAAAVLKDLPESKTVLPSHNSAVISLPFDLEFVYPWPEASFTWPLTTRQALLNDVLTFFGEIFYPYDAVEVSPVPAHLEAGNYPNPFNPATRIAYSLPRAGRLTVKVFNLRGELVSTLVDESRPAGPGHVMWEGTDAQGAAVSSGVYFCEVRSGGETRVQKMALLK